MNFFKDFPFEKITVYVKFETFINQEMSNSFGNANDAAHDLLRHVQPKDIEDRMYDVINLNEDLMDDLLSTIDVPLKVATDSSQKEFIKCDYNRDGDSYRSPYTNKYYPPLSDGQLPPPDLRKMEELGNKGFQRYLQQYFGSGVISCYCWEIDTDVFGIGIFVKKDLDGSTHNNKSLKGTISCSDVFEVSRVGGNQFQYSLVSSVILTLSIGTKFEPLTISGSLADQLVEKRNADGPFRHMVNAGQMVEKTASKFMSKVKQIYISKMQEIFSYMKSSSFGSSAGAPLAGGVPLPGMDLNAINNIRNRLNKN